MRIGDKIVKKVWTIGLTTVLAVGMCLSFSACDKENNETQEKYQVSQEEYEAAFSLDSFKNVTMSFVGRINDKDIQSYFYNDGDNYALCRYDGDMQYYGRYYGVENGEEFCYLYGNEQLENFTPEQAAWEKFDNPSAYKYEGVNFALSYKQEYSNLKYDAKTKAYSYTNSTYGTDIVYSYYFVDKKVTKYTVKEADEYIFVCDFYDYETTEIPALIEGIEPDKIEGLVQLRDILQTLPFEYNVEGLIEKYHFDTDQGFGYYLVDNSEDYCEFLSDIGVPYEGPFDELFEEKVMFCYLRCVSGSAEFIPVEYFYNAESNEIECKMVYQPEPNGGFADVFICWCVDLVEVPRNIFQQLNKE